MMHTYDYRAVHYIDHVRLDWIGLNCVHVTLNFACSFFYLFQSSIASCYIHHDSHSHVHAHSSPHPRPYPHQRRYLQHYYSWRLLCESHAVVLMFAAIVVMHLYLASAKSCLPDTCMHSHSQLVFDLLLPPLFVRMDDWSVEEILSFLAANDKAH